LADWDYFFLLKLKLSKKGKATIGNAKNKRLPSFHQQCVHCLEGWHNLLVKLERMALCNKGILLKAFALCRCQNAKEETWSKKLQAPEESFFAILRFHICRLTGSPTTWQENTLLLIRHHNAIQHCAICLSKTM
jgi:hypothetical protein